jgi:hypothetical protein
MSVLYQQPDSPLRGHLGYGYNGDRADRIKNFRDWLTRLCDLNSKMTPSNFPELDAEYGLMRDFRAAKEDRKNQKRSSRHLVPAQLSHLAPSSSSHPIPAAHSPMEILPPIASDQKRQAGDLDTAMTMLPPMVDCFQDRIQSKEEKKETTDESITKRIHYVQMSEKLLEGMFEDDPEKKKQKKQEIQNRKQQLLDELMELTK